MEHIPEDELIREAMRRLSHRRARVVRTCLVCGGPTDAALPHRRYCSRTCQQRAYRARVRQRQRGTPEAEA